jgi:Sigma-54 interaction domain
MENPSNVVAEGLLRAPGALDYQARRPEDWRQARAAYLSLLLIGMPRVNLLLIGVDGVVWNVLGTLLLDLEDPISTWMPGQPLVLPPAAQSGTLLLHDVGTMSQEEQLRLLAWLEQAAGRVQVVSTASGPVLPAVRTGAFLETLYYRLNTICVDLAA